MSLPTTQAYTAQLRQKHLVSSSYLRLAKNVAWFIFSLSGFTFVAHHLVSLSVRLLGPNTHLTSSNITDPKRQPPATYRRRFFRACTASASYYCWREEACGHFTCRQSERGALQSSRKRHSIGISSSGNRELARKCYGRCSRKHPFTPEEDHRCA